MSVCLCVPTFAWKYNVHRSKDLHYVLSITRSPCPTGIGAEALYRVTPAHVRCARIRILRINDACHDRKSLCHFDRREKHAAAIPAVKELRNSLTMSTRSQICTFLDRALPLLYTVTHIRSVTFTWLRAWSRHALPLSLTFTPRYPTKGHQHRQRLRSNFTILPFP